MSLANGSPRVLVLTGGLAARSTAAAAAAVGAVEVNVGVLGPHRQQLSKMGNEQEVCIAFLVGICSDDTSSVYLW